MLSMISAQSPSLGESRNAEDETREWAKRSGRRVGKLGAPGGAAQARGSAQARGLRKAALVSPARRTPAEAARPYCRQGGAECHGPRAGPDRSVAEGAEEGEVTFGGRRKLFRTAGDGARAGVFAYRDASRRAAARASLDIRVNAHAVKVGLSYSVFLSRGFKRAGIGSPEDPADSRHVHGLRRSPRRRAQSGPESGRLRIGPDSEASRAEGDEERRLEAVRVKYLGRQGEIRAAPALTRVLPRRAAESGDRQ